MKKRTARLLAVASTMLAVATPGALANPVTAPPPPGGTSGPTIDSVGGAGAEAGSDLACSPGAWLGNGTITFAYQWLADGTPIASATTDNYVVQEGDLGASIVCRVTATD